MTDGAYFSASALTVVLVASAVGKLRSPLGFRRALGTFSIIPTGAIPALVVMVPAVELVLATLQWVPSLRAAVSIGLAATLLAFTALLLHSLIRGEGADCGCFGNAAPERVSWLSIVRNVVLIALVVMGVVAGDGASRGQLPATLAGVGCGVLVLLLDQGVSLLTKTWAPSDRLRG